MISICNLPLVHSTILIDAKKEDFMSLKSIYQVSGTKPLHVSSSNYNNANKKKNVKEEYHKVKHSLNI